MKALLAAALAAGTLILSSGAPAQAAQCLYIAVNTHGQGLSTGHHYADLISGSGRAKKADKACDRARWECNRKLERALRRGNIVGVGTTRGAHCRGGQVR